MLLEALLMNHMRDIYGGSSSTPPSTDSTLQVITLSLKTSRPPKLLRSEEDQWVRQELIKTLNDFKQLIIAHLSPHTQQFTSYVKKSSVGHLVDTRSFHHHKRTRIKYQKSVVKVIRDMLIEKWIFIKRGKHLTALIKVVRFLEALRLPP
jgi:hypothetical protein